LLYTLSADGDLACWNTARDGSRVWSLNLYDRYRAGRRPNVGGGRRDYGYTTAPLPDGDLLLTAVGGRAGFLIAFDKRTGEQRWASSCKDFASISGGMSTMRVDGVPCVAALSLERLVVIRTDPGHEGETLAAHPWRTDYANNLVTPTVVGTRVILSSGYNQRRTVLLDVRRDRTVELWESRHYSAVGSPAVSKGKIYLPYQRLTCLDMTDGKLVWRGGRYGADASCLVTGDGYALAFGGGRLAVVEAADRSPAGYRELARRDGICRRNEAWPHVALADGRIYCKDRRGNITAFRVNP
jgi:outer membrane protein assembly factor BamB